MMTTAPARAVLAYGIAHRAGPVDSAGGVVACLYALDYPRELTGLISESFAHEIPAPDFALALLRHGGLTGQDPEVVRRTLSRSPQ